MKHALLFVGTGEFARYLQAMGPARDRRREEGGAIAQNRLVCVRPG